MGRFTLFAALIPLQTGDVILVNIEESMIRQIEADPASQFKRALYAEWLETRGRRAAIVRRQLDGECDPLIREDDRAWKVRLGYLPLVPDYLALTLEVPPTGVTKQVICSGANQIIFNPGQPSESVFEVSDEDWRFFWRVVYQLPPLFSRRARRNGCWHLTLEHDGIRTQYNEVSQIPNPELEIVCRVLDRMVDGNLGFGGRANSEETIFDQPTQQPGDFDV